VGRARERRGSRTRRRVVATIALAVTCCLWSTGSSSAKVGLPIAVAPDYYAFAMWDTGYTHAAVAVHPADPCSTSSPCDPTHDRTRAVEITVENRTTNVTCSSMEWTDGWHADPILWTATLKFRSACGDVDVSWAARDNPLYPASGQCDTSVNPTPHVCRPAYVTGTVGSLSFTPPPSVGMPNADGGMTEIWSA